ncbi:STAS domain-containing protein [Streptacidiphilus sp. PAMC 29251]
MTEQLAFTTVAHPERRAAVVTVAGVMDMETYAPLQQALLDLVDHGSVHLVLDLSHVTFCDSMGLNALLRACRHAQSRQGSLALAGVTASVARVLDITGAATVIAQHSSTGDALTSLTF